MAYCLFQLMRTEEWRRIFEKISEDTCYKMRPYRLEPMLTSFNLELEG